MRVASAMLVPARISIFLIGISVAVAFPGALYTGALAALSRYDLINLRSAISAVSRGLLLWFLLAHGYGLLSVAVATVVLTVLAYTVEFVLANRAY